MNLVSIRIITDNLERLVSFYEGISGLPATRYTPDFAELPTPTCTIAIGSARTMKLFGENIAEPARNRSVIIEFLVQDVDKEFERLRSIVDEFVQEPTTMPWVACPHFPHRTGYDFRIQEGVGRCRGASIRKRR
jgi:predicted enzyme related to lactoylglutathione lyase